MSANDTDRDTRRWIDEMVVELRLRGVGGAAIGDAVAAVESHCADSGESPSEAFGDPRAYATSLTFAEDDLTGDSLEEWVAVFAPVVVGLLGFSATTGAVSALLTGEGVAITRGGLASAAFLVVAVALLARFLRAFLAHGVAGALYVGGAIAVGAMLPMLWRTPLVVVPPLPAGIAGIALLALSVVLGRRARRLEDPVLDPVDRSDRYASRHPVLWAAVAGEWMFVVATVALSLLLWGLHELL